jgi:LPS O-antigen subunit length determinant protein (WzzB/FepE family)
MRFLTKFALPYFLVLAYYAHAQEEKDVLVIAKTLANSEEYKDLTYGSNRKEGQIDCVQFVVAVVEEALNQKLERSVKNQVLIANLTDEEKLKLEELVIAEDAKIRGVQQALVGIEKGTVVKPAEAKPGDIVQYWMKRKDGSWFGHAAIVESVSQRDGHTWALLFGSHQSTNRISSLDREVNLSSDDGRKVFLVRLKSS